MEIINYEVSAISSDIFSPHIKDYLKICELFTQEFQNGIDELTLQITELKKLNPCIFFSIDHDTYGIFTDQTCIIDETMATLLKETQ